MADRTIPAQPEESENAEISLKPAKTYGEQVEIIRSKGFIVDNDEVCIAFLQTTNYYRLSAYLLPFRKPDGSYFENIKFSRIQRIYEFDSCLRSVLFQCIEKIEIYLRTQIAYYSGHHFGALGYLNADNFSPRHNKEKFETLVLKCIEENKQSLVVKHHIEKYSGKFPVWVIIEFFSMGMLSYFYGDMKTQDQKALAKNMYQTSPAYLRSWLRCLTDLRNRCAHYARLYYWIFPAVPKLPSSTGYKADRKLFSQLLMLKLLYPDDIQWNERIFPQLEKLIKDYAGDISLKHIGFPKNWSELLEFENKRKPQG